MQFALVNGQRTTPEKGLKGLCPGCQKEVVAKCGKVKVHHWAHASNRDCDSWWEPETAWHLNWKNQFPKDYREKTFFAETGEPHRADIHTPRGVTIEFQNSSISIDELQSRVHFYKQLVWVVNAEPFRNNIQAYPIPAPEDPLLAEYEIMGYSEYARNYNEPTSLREARDFLGSLMLRKIPSNSTDKNGYRVYRLEDEIFNNVLRVTKRNPLLYQMFYWQYKRQAWLNCEAPVFFDFGDDCLRWLKRRTNPKDRMYYFKIISKAAFIKHYT